MSNTNKTKLNALQEKLVNLERGYTARKKKLTSLKNKQGLTQKEKDEVKLLEKQVRDYPAIIATTKKAISSLKSGASQTNAGNKKQTTNVRKRADNKVAKPGKKFKTTDKILVISIDDLSDPAAIGLVQYFKDNSDVPVTLFPHSGAKLLNPNILEKMRALPNAKLGWHGKKGKLDTNPVSGTNKSVIAWASGRDGEGRKKTIGRDTIARGVLCDRERGIGKFDQHDLPSCSLGTKSMDKTLKEQRDKVLANGGVLSVHLHFSDKEGIALRQLTDTVNAFRAVGGKIIHMEKLKGYGK